MRLSEGTSSLGVLSSTHYIASTDRWSDGPSDSHLEGERERERDNKTTTEMELGWVR